ncbi:MAG: hypothetical protein KKF44_03295 [Nanoarchaeota archaeon]|nr:hypothetical protein [Nanoarchaeota archaeon]
MMLSSLFKRNPYQNEWKIFAESFSLFYIEKGFPKIIGRFNDSDIEVRVSGFKKKNHLRHYTEIDIKHRNAYQQKVKVIHKKKFSKLSLLDKMHKNLGYSYKDNKFLDDYMLYSSTKHAETLPKDIKRNFKKLISHDMKIDREKIRYSEPKIISCHNRLIDLVFFLTEFSKEVGSDNFNQIQEVIKK